MAGIIAAKDNKVGVVGVAPDAGLIVVAAAGNNNGGSTVYPAAYEGVISVNAIDDRDIIASFSAKGKIDFTAPGVDICSTYLDNSYVNLSGTSMAAPHVTGVFALMLADRRNDTDRNGSVSTKEVLNVVLNSIEDVGSVGYDEIYGNGILKCKK